MFQLISTLSVSASNGKQLIQGLNKSSLLVEISGEKTFQNGDLLESVVRNGRVFGCRWLQGNLRGQLQPLEYGQHEILFDVPSPLDLFDLEIIPNRYQFEYVVKVYTKTLNPRLEYLAAKLGIGPEILENIPEQTLLILEGINLMASTDTLGLVQALEAQQALIDAANASISTAQQAANAANAAALTAQQKADLVDSSLILATNEMVLSREFAITANMFTLEDGLMKVTVSHDLTESVPQMSLTDEEGDEQGVAQLKSLSPTQCQIVLTPTQHSDNTYPMLFLLQGKKGASNSAWKIIPTGDKYWRLMDGNLDRSSDGISVELPQFVSNVAEAFMSATAQFVYYKLVDGSYGAIENGNLGAGLQVKSQSEYDTAKAIAGSVTL